MAALYQRDFHIKCESRAVRQDMAPSPTEAKGEGSPQAANSASSEAEAEGVYVSSPPVNNEISDAGNIIRWTTHWIYIAGTKFTRHCLKTTL